MPGDVAVWVVSLEEEYIAMRWGELCEGGVYRGVSEDVE